MPDTSRREDEGDLDAVQSLIDVGSEIVGSTGGTAAGFLVAGPVGAFAGAAAGPIIAASIRRVGSDIRRRMLGPREAKRIGATVSYAAEAIQERLDAGHVPRSDGFFEAASETERPLSEEVLEGVLLSARDSYEERKLPHLGRLYSAVAFDPSISANQANHMLVLANRLAFQQLAVMGLLLHADEVGRLRDRDYRDGGVSGGELVSLLTQIYGLYQDGLISHRAEEGRPSEAMISVADVIPRKLTLQGIGGPLAVSMRLDLVSPDTRHQLSELLST